MLAAQGISDDQILTMLGYDPAESDMFYHTLTRSSCWSPVQTPRPAGLCS